MKLVILLIVLLSVGNAEPCPWFNCPSQCDDLHLSQSGFKVCANNDCMDDCDGNCVYDCPWDAYATNPHTQQCQSTQCQCHDDGCSQCETDHFKLNFDFKCQHCQETFGLGCLHCSDFHGCQQCASGYTRTAAVGCGSESDQYDPNRPVYYCLPNGEQPCDSFEPSPTNENCFECPPLCDDLHFSNDGFEVCANNDCMEHCGGNCVFNCPWDAYITNPQSIQCQSPQCQCHNNGCDQCETGYFKVNYDYKCVSCAETFGVGCLHCSDFHGCQQCDEQNGYIRVADPNCGSESDHYDPLTPVHYCKYIEDTCNPSQSPPASDPTPNPVDIDGNDSECPIELPLQCMSEFCENDGENPHCSDVFEYWGACESCTDGYWFESFNHPCVQCDIIPGCQECVNWDGCSKCNPYSTRTWSQECDIYVCEFDIGIQ